MAAFISHKNETNPNRVLEGEIIIFENMPESKKKVRCLICDDTGYFTNPFDQTFKCNCKKKKKEIANGRTKKGS